MSAPATLRLVGLSWWFHLKMLSRSAFDGVLGVLWPLFFATTAFLMYGAGDRGGDALVYAAIGASVMGVWSAIATTASGVLQRERWHGTLELLVAAPAPFSVVIFPITIAMSTLGLYSMVATLLWGRFAFGIDITIAHPVLFVLAVVVTIVAIGMLGFLLSVTVVRYRTAWALGNMLEYPVWLICGFLVPLSLFPGWLRPVSWVLAPTWGMNAIRSAAAGGSPWVDLGVCVALALAYGLVGFLFAEAVLRSARRHATLALT